MAWRKKESAAGGSGEAAVRRSSVFVIWLERSLFIAGSVGIFYCLATGVQMFAARRAAERVVIGQSVAVSGSQPTVSGPNASPASSYVAVGDARVARPAVVGRVEIPAIGLRTPLLDGDDSMSLTEGAGHIPGTALPGGLGTVGIAGHRDTHFRLLAKATIGMEVRLVTREGVYRYRIVSSEIVTPEQVSVLDIVQVPSLVLVTCYPFRFIGHAPKRFIVHADLVSVTPDNEKSGSRRR